MFRRLRRFLNSMSAADQNSNSDEDEHTRWAERGANRGRRRGSGEDALQWQQQSALRLSAAQLTSTCCWSFLTPELSILTLQVRLLLFLTHPASTCRLSGWRFPNRFHSAAVRPVGSASRWENMSWRLYHKRKSAALPQSDYKKVKYLPPSWK